VAEKVIDGVTFVPITELTSDIHPQALSFAITFDVPLFRRTDNIVERQHELSSYYADEKQLVQMLKPEMKKRASPLHALDSLQHDSAFQVISDENPSHFSQVHRTILFTGITKSERRELERRWVWANRKITLFSLEAFWMHVQRLVASMTQSIEVLVRKKVKKVQQQWHARRPPQIRMSVENGFGEQVITPMWKVSPM
jgi:hypothetical protein